jgi:hypothetical protein
MWSLSDDCDSLFWPTTEFQDCLLASGRAGVSNRPETWRVCLTTSFIACFFNPPTRRARAVGQTYVMLAAGNTIWSVIDRSRLWGLSIRDGSVLSRITGWRLGEDRDQLDGSDGGTQATRQDGAWLLGYTGRGTVLGVVMERSTESVVVYIL